MTEPKPGTPPAAVTEELDKLVNVSFITRGEAEHFLALCGDTAANRSALHELLVAQWRRADTEFKSKPEVAQRMRRHLDTIRDAVGIPDVLF